MLKETPHPQKIEAELVEKLVYTQAEFKRLAHTDIPCNPDQDLLIYDGYFEDSAWEKLFQNQAINVEHTDLYSCSGLAIQAEQLRLILLGLSRKKKMWERVFIADLSEKLPAYRLVNAHATRKKWESILDYRDLKTVIQEGTPVWRAIFEQLKRVSQILQQNPRADIHPHQDIFNIVETGKNLKDGYNTVTGLFLGSAYSANN